MDDRVKELLDRIRAAAVTAGQAAGATACRAARSAGELADIAKLNMKVFDLRTGVNELLREVGQVVYDTHLGQDGPGQERLEALLAQIDDKNKAIDACRQQVAALKHCRPCPACGAVCGRDDRFCKHCGAAL